MNKSDSLRILAELVGSFEEVGYDVSELRPRGRSLVDDEGAAATLSVDIPFDAGDCKGIEIESTDATITGDGRIRLSLDARVDPREATGTDGVEATFTDGTGATDPNGAEATNTKGAEGTSTDSAETASTDGGETASTTGGPAPETTHEGTPGTAAGGATSAAGSGAIQESSNVDLPEDADDTSSGTHDERTHRDESDTSLHEESETSHHDGSEPSTGESAERARSSTADDPGDAGVREAASGADGRTGSDAADPDSTDEPAHRDPERLREVYAEDRTFEEMRDALGVDVTAQTVRKHMVKHGIHEPASHRSSATPDDDSDGTATADDPDDGRTDDDRLRTRTVDEIVDDIGIDSSPSIGEIVRAVHEHRTLYEAQRALDLDRDSTRQLLEALNLIDLFHGRLSTNPEDEVTEEEIEARIRAIADG